MDAAEMKLMDAGVFGSQAAEYALRRPGYPRDLFSDLSDLTSASDARRVAWDCGAGTGLASIRLANHFDVVATDVSPKMLRSAIPHPRIRYVVAKAEESGLASNSVDIVTAAAAVHWFDTSAFYGEVSRVLRPNGIVAAFSYFLPELGASLDSLVRQVVDIELEEFWDPRMILTDGDYRRLFFPFEDVDHREYRCREFWTADDLLHYIKSWSASQVYRRVRGEWPTKQVENRLRVTWAHTGANRRIVDFPLHTKIGRLSRSPLVASSHAGLA